MRLRPPDINHMVQFVVLPGLAMDRGDSDGESNGDVDSGKVSSSDSDTPREREPMVKKQKLISSTRKHSGSTTYQSSW